MSNLNQLWILEIQVQLLKGNRLFSKFSSNDPSGTGLGLYISKKILRLMTEEFGLKIILISTEPRSHLHCPYDYPASLIFIFLYIFILAFAIHVLCTRMIIFIIRNCRLNSRIINRQYTICYPLGMFDYDSSQIQTLKG